MRYHQYFLIPGDLSIYSYKLLKEKVQQKSKIFFIKIKNDKVSILFCLNFPTSYFEKVHGKNLLCLLRKFAVVSTKKLSSSNVCDR